MLVQKLPLEEKSGETFRSINKKILEVLVSIKDSYPELEKFLEMFLCLLEIFLYFCLFRIQSFNNGNYQWQIDLDI